jgi:hypothetical protein
MMQMSAPAFLVVEMVVLIAQGLRICLGFQSFAFSNLPFTRSVSQHTALVFFDGQCQWQAHKSWRCGPCKLCAQEVHFQSSNVINCSALGCRATVMESGKDRPAETWDFGAGDVWYFRPNEGHMVQGLRPGCTYLAGMCIAHTARRASAPQNKYCI